MGVRIICTEWKMKESDFLGSLSCLFVPCVILPHSAWRRGHSAAHASAWESAREVAGTTLRHIAVLHPLARGIFHTVHFLNLLRG